MSTQLCRFIGKVTDFIWVIVVSPVMLALDIYGECFNITSIYHPFTVHPLLNRDCWKRFSFPYGMGTRSMIMSACLMGSEVLQSVDSGAELSHDCVVHLHSR